MNKNLKIVYGYPYYPSQAYDDTQQMALRYANRLREYGYNIIPFCLTLNSPNSCLSFDELDFRWQIGDRELLKMYEQLEEFIRLETVMNLK
ncbi:hypothetical protein [Anaerosinus massiliensis]|uniref:hypothetical protein n=1 Tax=Massilibacillus massiliensis TaxID=1806837 RepID=UPI000DA5F45B|nr:hypothetical protein [Massilibacillus massiliensis]